MKFLFLLVATTLSASAVAEVVPQALPASPDRRPDVRTDSGTPATPAPAVPLPAAARVPKPAPPVVRVWANTKTGV